MYSALTITNSYKANDNVGCQSFILSKKPYNPITGQKVVDSNMIVSYTNVNGHYDSLRDSLKRTVVSSHSSNESQSSILTMNAKLKTRKELNSQLNLIEEQYSTMGSQAFKRRKASTSISALATANSS
ncbi:15563_t:CDS:2, partial [Gigaspora margarita]